MCGNSITCRTLISEMCRRLEIVTVGIKIECRLLMLSIRSAVGQLMVVPPIASPATSADQIAAIVGSCRDKSARETCHRLPSFRCASCCSWRNSGPATCFFVLSAGSPLTSPSAAASVATSVSAVLVIASAFIASEKERIRQRSFTHNSHAKSTER